MHIEEFMERFGVRATARHLLDYVTHTEPDELGRRHELIRRQWAIVYEHADVQHGDQRVLTLDYDTSTSDGHNQVNAGEVLAQVIIDACSDGRSTFEEYIDEFAQYQRYGANQIVANASRHPQRLYEEWIGLVHLNHRIVRWCSSPEMRAALDEIRID